MVPQDPKINCEKQKGQLRIENNGEKPLRANTILEVIE